MGTPRVILLPSGRWSAQFPCERSFYAVLRRKVGGYFRGADFSVNSCPLRSVRGGALYPVSRHVSMPGHGYFIDPVGRFEARPHFN